MSARENETFQHVEFFIEIDVLDERWVTLEEGAMSSTYARVACEQYQEEFPGKTVRIVKKTTTCEVVDA